MWYTPNPDYDITRLICYSVSYFKRRVQLLSLEQMSLKNHFRRHSSNWTCSHSQCQVKISMWTRVKCELVWKVGGKAQSRWSQTNNCWWEFVEPIYYKSGFLGVPVHELDFKIFGNNEDERKLQGPSKI